MARGRPPDMEPLTEPQRQMMEENRALVWLAVNLFYQNYPQHCQGYTVDEVASEGFMILLRCCKSFRPELGYQFSTYAVSSIQQQLLRRLRGSASVVHIPVHSRDPRAKYYRKAASALYPRGLKEDWETCATVQQEDRDLQIDVADALRSLPPRLYRVLAWRYGLCGERAFTLEEIGRRMDLSRQGVCLLLERAYDQLRPLFRGIR